MLTHFVGREHQNLSQAEILDVCVILSQPEHGRLPTGYSATKPKGSHTSHTVALTCNETYKNEK